MKAIVTGHSRGLGAAIADELLARDIPVLALARSANPVLAQRYGARCVQVEVDLADSTAFAAWLATGRLREFLTDSDEVLLVNNAGTLRPTGALAAHDVADIARAVSLNVAAPLMLAAAVVAASPAAIERRIMHISSGAARSAYAGWSVYCASKAALDQHARAVALDRSPGIRICSLAPGVIDTAMQAEIRAIPQDDFPLRARFEALKRDGALQRPEDCARRVVDYLLGIQFGEHPVADLRELGT
ncbi:SDR family oxidoreductase [Azoarcus sp. KH32C]|uniref:SDR family oxidoreductase n=1 Tax=Azoarcus sp. KH32C TaxID=748247 RepID=UPI00023868BE|nr:SDR family oxidoreductase [Azoarcus sp. KH32C]BAL26454.1 short-chain dehydrogenase/reductase SDR [Azoarcus sp. KH32C]